MSFPQVDPAPENAGAVRIGQWLVVGIVAMIVAAMLAFDYTRSYSTMANVIPSSHPSTTGAVPASPKIIAALCLNELRVAVEGPTHASRRGWEFRTAG